MLLKKIKLSGFKSFVDPTMVLLPSQLIAVVGPNGCGKSNIIDAVCWVMGESSAKYLRGESLTDVIFNGSSARKPVGQASVELIFDNQDGSLGGEYASYAEISIKRAISRDAESSYFLNGARCRRKDIIDIFLGTGLGPRSYSIIGQNMISRIIEAKPDDMRTYLEEAAGISKYKERRRETENRIHHTKENLARLNDIRAELEKQLNTLKRQASAAEKFKTLKQEERIIRAQWYGIQWRTLDARMVQHMLQIQQQETGLEARLADLSEITRLSEQRRDDQKAKNEALHDVQRRYYAVGNDITRIEQDIRHQEDRKHQWQSDLDQVEKDSADAKNHFDELQDQLTELKNEVLRLEPDSIKATELAEQLAEAYAEAEEAMQLWQTRWDDFNQRTAKTTQTAQVEQTRIQHLEQKIAAIKQLQAKLEQEKSQIDDTQLEKEIGQLAADVSTQKEQSHTYESQLTTTREKIKNLQAAQQQTVTELDQVRRELQRFSGQQASLEALQQTALGQRNNPVLPWLAKHQLDRKPRLAQVIEVESGWEHAVEKVLGTQLQSVCVEQLSDITDLINEFQDGNLSVFSKTHKPSAQTAGTTLLSKIKSQLPLDSLLSNIYIAETLPDALQQAEKLAAHESIVTRDGIWLSASWLRVFREKNPAAGVLQREQELKQLAKQITELSAQQKTLEDKLAQIREQLKLLEQDNEQLQHAVHKHHTQTAEVEAQWKIKQERLTTLKNQAARIQKEYDESIKQLQQTEHELTQARSTWQSAMNELETSQTQRESLQQERDTTRTRLQEMRDRLDEAREEAHQLEIRWQTTQSQQASLQQTLSHLQTQLATFAERKTALEKELAAVSSLAELEQALNELLNKRLGIEEELNTARTAVERIEQDLRALENKRQEEEREISRFREFLETLRVDWQGLKVKSETLLEQAKELGFLMEDILPNIPVEATAEQWQANLEQITQRITRLGPINLVAIEEYATCQERKEYLDKQYDDLQQGLTTLENAIDKIDKETRARFRETFELVNTRFQELFPQIFGGGRAYLELTGDNLLDTGITVMACPPGKRNSTIHLLSGGEKAMTAIALVFSIFHLNPAPFCLLDEVDAPLDDANIGRFCRLVKAMSEKTQFIFISHNKLAIELAEHLIGVTMHEPGVSRLVSVNVQEAISLAGA